MSIFCGKLSESKSNEISIQAIRAPPTVQIKDHKASVGSEVGVPIWVIDSGAIAGGSLKVAFDESIARVKEVSAGDFGSPVSNINNEKGFVKVAVARPEAIGKPKAELAVLTFKAVRKGRTPLSIKNAELNDEEGNLITPRTDDGSIGTHLKFAIVRAGSAKGKRGDVVEVPISISNAEGVAGIQFKLVFDPSAAEVEKVCFFLNVRNAGRNTSFWPTFTEST